MHARRTSFYVLKKVDLWNWNLAFNEQFKGNEMIDSDNKVGTIFPFFFPVKSKKKFFFD